MNRISAPLLVVFALVSASVLHTCGTLRADEQSPTTQTSGQGERPAEEGERPAEEGERPAGQGERQRGDRCPFAPEDDAESDIAPSSLEPATKPSPPEPRITIGRETTFIEGPLTDDGYVDYLAALNERLSEGVTPENNAAVLLWQCWGPSRRDEGDRAEFFARLGVGELPIEGDYLKGHFAAARPAGDDPDGAPELERVREERYQEFLRSLKAPWKRAEFPLSAAWVDASEKPLAMAIAATKRPRFYQPVLDSGMPLVAEATNAALPATQGCRNLAQDLKVRAMMRLGEGDVEGAWEDNLAIHRLAHLISQGPTILESLTALPISGIACQVTETLLHSAEVTADQAGKMEADLRALPPMPSMAEKYDVAERVMFLDFVTTLARGRGKDFVGFLGAPHDEEEGGAARLTEELLGSIIDGILATQVDWNETLRMGNQWYDRVVESARKPTYAERQEALVQVEAELEALSRRAQSPTSLYAQATLKGESVRTTAGRHVGMILVSMSFPIPSRMSAVEDRELARVDLIRVAVAIAGYKAKHGKSPDRLEDLAPAHIPEVPLDRYTDKPLVYKKTDDGYLLYALGPNLKDDGGRRIEDDRVNYDIVVRMPASD